jgi:hypothetical protein
MYAFGYSNLGAVAFIDDPKLRIAIFDRCTGRFGMS